MKPCVTAVIPARNEATRVAAVVRQCTVYVDEVIVVDDASEDATAHAAAVAGARVVHLERHSGYIRAVKAGFQAAGPGVVVTLDADGEYPADAIPTLVAPVLAGAAEMAQGARRPADIRWSERMLTRLARMAGPVGDSGTGLRAVDRDVAANLDIRGVCICGVLSLEVLAKGGRITDVPVILRPTSKRRRIPWFHVRQLFHVLAWLVRGGRTAVEAVQ